MNILRHEIAIIQTSVYRNALFKCGKDSSIFKLLFQLVRIATIINNALSLNQQILDRFWIKIKHNQTLFLDFLDIFRTYKHWCRQINAESLF